MLTNGCFQHPLMARMNSSLYCKNAYNHLLLLHVRSKTRLDFLSILYANGWEHCGLVCQGQGLGVGGSLKIPDASKLAI